MQLSLTYKGKDKFKTLGGGIISIIVKLITFAVALTLTVTVFQRGKSATSINTIYKDLTNDQTKHYFMKDTIYFGLKLIGPNPEKLLDPTYFTFQIIQMHINKINSPELYTTNSTVIEYEFWGDKFPHVR